MKVTLFRRDGSDLTPQPAVEFKVKRHSHHVMGGPKAATIEASGKAEAIFELVNRLRSPIEITNNAGDLVWWGLITAVEIHTPVITYGVDLETMFNNVAVAYTDQGIRFTTQWSSDADSIADYGTKELLLSRSEATEADALQFRDVYLANAKYPIPVLKFSGGDAGTATVTCKGWYSTLEWQYYANLTGREGYEESGDGGREIGEDDRPKLAQSFQIAATTAWVATSVWLKVWKQGTEEPGDNLVVSIKNTEYSDPGTTLASGQLGAAEIGTDAEWLEFVLDSPVILQPSTTYWVHVARSGAVDADAYYMVDTNYDAGYPRGLLYLYNANEELWGEDIYKFWGDLLFIVVGVEGTTDQISTLVSNCGQFLVGTIIEDESGLDSNPYRAGDTAGLFEMDKLLNAGTENFRRLLCEVTHNRYLRVYEEPAKPEDPKDSYALDKDGKLLFKNDTPTDQTLCLVGIWCHLKDIIPPSVDLSLVADPSLFFIDEAEYDVEKDQYLILATRNQADVMAIGGVVQG